MKIGKLFVGLVNNIDKYDASGTRCWRSFDISWDDRCILTIAGKVNIPWYVD